MDSLDLVELLHTALDHFNPRNENEKSVKVAQLMLVLASKMVANLIKLVKMILNNKLTKPGRCDSYTTEWIN